MATTWIAQNPRRYGNDSNAAPEMASLLVDGSATWKKGEFLRLDNDGLLYQGATSSASGVGADALTHQAVTNLDAAIGADTTRNTVAVIHVDDRFLMHEKDGAVTAAMQGQNYGLNVTSNVQTVDTSAVTHTAITLLYPMYVVNPYDGDTVSDTCARALCKVMETTIDAVPT